MFVTNGRDVACNVRKKEERGKKEEGVNIEKKGKKIDITISKPVKASRVKYC
ncbi:MAG: hypothetical protein F6K54_16715 [Okeania sp. SIO3B5]|uniref:hypothetical protein n=1 Tax=Okeania sp. SIO3B5 TaxID=2607811 RepID=UPI0013FFF32F|nr:hypothetical protein [Okeania sp. SIO3B5]NEO54580.1 hypothetical protein [Okeania sp. SIO3B5]